MTGSTPEYQNKDDGLHRYNTPDYYEWWYFDADFDNGYSCVLVYHWLNGFQKPRHPVITINIYTPDGQNLVWGKIVDANDCSAREDRCDVKLGISFARQEDDFYRVSMPRKRLGADLVFRSKLPGWKPKGTGYLYDDGIAKQGWLVPMPRAEVEGTLYIEREAMLVKGLGYHDHNWSNVNMHDSFHSWFWGRFHHPVYTLIYYYLYPAKKNDPIQSGLYLAKGNTPILTPDHFELTTDKEEIDEVTGKSVPRNLFIKGGEGDVEVECQINAKSIFDSNRLPEVGQYYWRFTADYQADIKIGSVVDKIFGRTMSEYMLLR